ncbi:hypothetical protein [Endozoicomonas montiporae]|nr:hypothetical protein [Endozoicomonas montiporae]AMO54773.1 hypothetical protein EZMO1_0526 [Endozoicomonas montiporae CL-33]
MQRIVWLGYLFGVLLLMLAAQRVALATHNAEDTSSKLYENFRSKLSAINASTEVIRYSKPIYDLLSITEQSTDFSSVSHMLSVLRSGWDKERLSYTVQAKEQVDSANKALRNTPVFGAYSSGQIDDSGFEQKAYYHNLMIFVSSHPGSMSKHILHLRAWMNRKIGKNSLPTSIILITSDSKFYSRLDIAENGLEPGLIKYLNETFKGDGRLSQGQLAKEIILYYFKDWTIIKTIDIGLHSGALRSEFEKGLSDERDFINYSDLTLVTPQPFCELAKTIVRHKLPTQSFKFYHSCYDDKKPHAQLETDDIADRLDAFKEWINTENEYQQNTQH